MLAFSSGGMGRLENSASPCSRAALLAKTLRNTSDYFAKASLAVVRS